VETLAGSIAEMGKLRPEWVRPGCEATKLLDRVWLGSHSWQLGWGVGREEGGARPGDSSARECAGWEGLSVPHARPWGELLSNAQGPWVGVARTWGGESQDRK
jgi:hypothetical protein